jgi:hypothetical protein
MTILTNNQALPASFRDPAGFLYKQGPDLLRQINPAGYEDYFAAINSGFYQDLMERGWLVPHEELTQYEQESPPDKIIIKPEKIPFISYPYEWSFSQLKTAAQLTLKIQAAALSKNLTLKDSSAYNIQFLHGKPVLIDTLSFERYQEGEPWSAYRQFCQHFLTPLALMAYTDVRLSQLLRTYIDGIPLDLASKLLPRKSSLNLGINMHIHLHAKSQSQYSGKTLERKSDSRKMHKHQLQGLVQNLESTLEKLTWKPEQTDWAEYEKFHNYSTESFQHKEELVSQYLDQTKSSIVWDLGANTGRFSRLASNIPIDTVSFDIDPGAVELNYKRVVEDSNQHILPLVMDLSNPSPGLGWRLEERDSLFRRGPADTVLALALVHHLVIGNNVPLPNLVAFFAEISNWLIIEFVPKSDPQVKKLLQVRRDIFSDYNLDAFLDHFKVKFDLLAEDQIKGSQRTLFLFKIKH